ncbi:scm-like with four MBT domains protein 1 [Fopius arisanus]|uniref:Scm-like with four MBT domains protein 1 n=1 Tax=Fopius arisanus TaxID=64838 RepID=A0A9R1T8X6_9HYME|nr:PREDICTED: scm-like with four MBT domains protein 1 [Fopius arisanus]
MDMNKKRKDDRIIDEDDDFVWQDYLDATGTIEVPQINFPHVELTLQNGIEIGMALEVPTSKNDKCDTSYWIATIVMACGPLLRLRYFGGDDRTLEFWFNLTKEAAHELGWCVKNDKKLEPPDAIVQRSPDCLEMLPGFLMTAKSVPHELLSGEELSMSEKIKQGMKIEVVDFQHPYKLWVATIIENVGGRLLLRYNTPGSQFKDFWIFCTSEALHHYGFASKCNSKWFLEPPSSIVDAHSYEEWKAVVESSQKEVPTANLFQELPSHPVHQFKLGMKLEALSPTDRTRIYPATVAKIYDDTYFLVQIDNVDTLPITDVDSMKYESPEKTSWLCTSVHPYIFPINWAKTHNIKFSPPKNWKGNSGDFDWKKYMKETKSTPAPMELFPNRQSAVDAGFEEGMRLEAVDPRNENIICAAHITRIIEDLLFLSLDNYEWHVDHIVHMHSLQIFPVGWCESNHYPLKPPRDYMEVCKKLEKPEKEENEKLPFDVSFSELRSSLWCPKIYFNYRCCTGPMISKGKLAALPKAVGPGPVVLVMREVLSMIVSVGYRSARILKVLQCDTKPDPGYHLEILKAKYKNNTYRASVAVITSGDMVADFCKSICKKLMVCQNLFGPHEVEAECPDKCSRMNKSKYVAIHNGKRGKPKGYESILVQKPKPWGKKKRKRRGRWANRDKEGSDNGEREEEINYFSLDLERNNLEEIDECVDGKPQLSEIDVMIQKGESGKEERSKPELGSSNASDDSRSSFNERRGKEIFVDSPGSSNEKNSSKSGKGDNGKSRKRDRDREADFDDEGESEGSEDDVEYIERQKKQRRPKTRKLDSNPLFWTVDDVFRYLKKTNDCKDIADRVKQEEIDGLAFLLLNLPSLTQHMKLRTSLAMKLCRHVEQVKVTFFLRHINELENDNKE